MQSVSRVVLVLWLLGTCFVKHVRCRTVCLRQGRIESFTHPVQMLAPDRSLRQLVIGGSDARVAVEGC